MSTSPPEPTSETPDRIDFDDTVTQSADDVERSRELSLRLRQAPSSVPGYEILECLGEGAFGSVWLAKETVTGKRVAIKFYTHRRGLDWSLLSREVEKLAVLYTSRNIVGILDVGWEHDPPYYVMEYLENGSLASRLQAGPLSVEEVARVAKDICRALVHAHGRGILHCDLKPANVLFDANLEARLCDFGQSRLADEQSAALGTLFFMAPEQASFEAVPHAKWDVYALGALIYTMLAGEAPHRTEENEQRIQQGDTLKERLEAYQDVTRAPVPIEALTQQTNVDRRLAEIVEDCLESDPQNRTQNVQLVLTALEEREQAKAKRPLTALSIIGPLCFLVAIGWVALRAIPRAVETAESNLVEQALAGDVVSVGILARSVEQDLDNRRTELEDIASLRRLKELISTDLLDDVLAAKLNDEEFSKELQQLWDFLSEKKATSDERRAARGRKADASWFLTDADGNQIYREPRQDATLGENFAWRDYYHGLGREYPDETSPDRLEPRQVSGISLPFRSNATNEYMIAIAVPVWDEQRENVIGLLARTTHLTDLLQDWKVLIVGSDRGEARRFIALADRRGDEVHLLDHPWMTEKHLTGLTDEELERTFDLLTLDEIPETRGDRHYIDPVSLIDDTYSGEWLAAFAPVGNTGWSAIVQERRGEALEPVDQLKGVFIDSGVLTLIILSVMIAILWFLIHRASA